MMEMDGSALKGERLAQGREAEVFAWGEGRVLKLFLSDWRPRVEHEFMVARTAFAGGVNTPEPVEILEMDGRPGIVYQRVDGGTMTDAIKTQPYRICSLARQFGELHASLHRVKAPESLKTAHAGLEHAIRQAADLPEELRQGALKLLAQLPAGDRLLHGDYHPENVIVQAGRMVIIDWPNACAGDPLADVARSRVILRMATIPEWMSPWMRMSLLFVRHMLSQQYTARYRQMSKVAFQLLPPWEVVVAAGRLNERIPGEAGRLLPFIRQGLAKYGVRA